jgi:pimeloyl-ACP methyl ester carboxylesterase
MFIQAHGARHHAIVADRHGTHDAPVAGQPIVVMVHGVLNDTFASFYLSLHWPLARLGMTNFMYDRRGHGRSAYVPRTLTLQQATADLLAMLDALGVQEPVHLLGNSLGACVATDFVVHHPDRAASLVLLEGEPPTTAWRRSMLDGMAYGLDETSPYRQRLMAGRDCTRHERRAAAGFRLLDETTLFRDIGASRVVDDAAIASLSLPILGLYGDQSELGVHERMTATTAHMPNVSCQVIAGAGHLLLFDAAPEVSRRLEAFYRLHEPRCLPGGLAP